MVSVWKFRDLKYLPRSPHRYQFGWESQLLETGFLAIFLCPLFTLKAKPENTPTSKIVLWLFRWLLFRIMLGAGLIKIRGDACWKDFTCMNYHYETQPIPNPLSWYLHKAPEFWHMFEVGANHFVELVAPFLLITPIRVARLAGAWMQIVFQLVLISSGNLSFLNFLTIAPALACFDDRHLSSVISEAKVKQLKVHIARIVTGDQNKRYARKIVHVALLGFIAFLSVPVVQNLLSKDQVGVRSALS